MRRILALFVSVTAMEVVCVTAQGTLNFINSTAQRVETPDGVHITSAMGYRVELVWGRSQTTITNGGYYTGFSAIAGIFNGGVVTLPGTTPGDRPWVSIRVWNTKGMTFPTWEMAVQHAFMNRIEMGETTWQLAAGLGGLAPDGTTLLTPTLAQAGFVAPYIPYPFPVVCEWVHILNLRASDTEFQFELEGRPTPQGFFNVLCATSLKAEPRWETWVLATDATSRVTVRVPMDLVGPSGFFKALWWYYESTGP